MSAYKNTQALVINRKTLQDNDLLITLLTPDMGKIIARAKGAKSITSRRLGSLQIGNLIKISLYLKNNYYYLGESITLDSFLRYQKNYTQIGLLFYFLELLNRLVAENQQIPGIYSIAKSAIQAVGRNSLPSFIRAEIRFISLLGFGLPPALNSSYQQADYQQAQRLIRLFFEELVEKKLESQKLFN